jgi:hypothetical protein
LREVIIMETKFLLKFVLAVLVFTAVSWGDENSLKLFDKKWKLESFFNAETNTFEEPDRSGVYDIYFPPGPPRNCHDCYTLIFSPDTTNLGVSISGEKIWECRGIQDYVSFGCEYIIHYTDLSISISIVRPLIADSHDGEKYYNALMRAQRFELTDTYLKLYYVPYYSDKMHYLLFKPWTPPITEIPEPLTLFGTKWQLKYFFNAGTGIFEAADYSGFRAGSEYPTNPSPFDRDSSWLTLEFSSEDFQIPGHTVTEWPDGYVPTRPLYIGRLGYLMIDGIYIADYETLTISIYMVRPLMIDSDHGERFADALERSHKFELTKTDLKLFYGNRGDFLLLEPWTPAPVSVASTNRELPQPTPPEEATDLAPAAAVDLTTASTAAGPNPVSRSGGLVRFYRRGGPPSRGTLKVFDASGRLVRKIRISDPGETGASDREVGSWDLRDTRGRLVAEGAYLVRGAVKAPGGKSERVSLVLGVR